MRRRGEDHHNAKTTEDKVREIRRRFVPSMRTDGNCAELAAEYGLSKEAIRKIASGSRWSWLDRDEKASTDVWQSNAPEHEPTYNDRNFGAVSPNLKDIDVALEQLKTAVWRA